MARFAILLTALFFSVVAAAQAGFDPVYNQGMRLDHTTGDNFVAGKGWYVDPDADSHVNDLIRERPLSTNTFSYDSSSGQWVHPGTYYAYLDIKKAEWGFDGEFMYFKMTLFGKGSNNDKFSNMDFDTFGSGTLYNILIGQDPDGEANSSLLLRIDGDAKELRTGDGGVHKSKAAQGFWDEDGDVGDSAITATKEGGDIAGDGYEREVISSDGKLGGSGPEVLFARIDPGPDSISAMPTVEIAFNYSLWNLNAPAMGLDPIDPLLTTFLVFEADRGTKDNANYLWNDKYTIGEEGSPYKINDEKGKPIDHLQNVYELDRLYWERPTVVPENGNLWSALVALSIGLACVLVRRVHTKRLHAQCSA